MSRLCRLSELWEPPTMTSPSCHPWKQWGIEPLAKTPHTHLSSAPLPDHSPFIPCFYKLNETTAQKCLREQLRRLKSDSLRGVTHFSEYFKVGQHGKVKLGGMALFRELPAFPPVFIGWQSLTWKEDTTWASVTLRMTLEKSDTAEYEEAWLCVLSELTLRPIYFNQSRQNDLSICEWLTVRWPCLKVFQYNLQILFPGQHGKTPQWSFFYKSKSKHMADR